MQIKITRMIEIPVEVTATIEKGSHGSIHEPPSRDSIMDVSYNLPANAILEAYKYLKNEGWEETKADVFMELNKLKMAQGEV